MAHSSQDDIWVFGYGSLMWNPGFHHLDSQIATLNGFHRAPCIYSWVHRGTRERPGIVFGLAPGGTCTGIAFKIEGSQSTETIEYLRSRELVTNVYLETRQPIFLKSGESVEAVTYIADTTHEQYAGQLSEDALVRQISGSIGRSGNNEDYICDTVRKLQHLEIDDPLMLRIANALEAPQPTND